MDVTELVKKHWVLIDLVANHDNIPNGANSALSELSQHYPTHIDMWCGHCLVSMCKWFYENYKYK